MDTLNMGGSEHTVPAHAIVIMLGFLLEPTEVTRTTGHGKRAVRGLFLTFMQENSLVFDLNLCISIWVTFAKT